jgi:putative DNA primase/helicase
VHNAIEQGLAQLDAMPEPTVKYTEQDNSDGSINILDMAKASKDKKAKREAERIASGLPYGFSLSNAGVFYTPEGTDDKPGKPMRVCAPLRVTALIRDKSSENWGRVIEFHDADGVRHEWAVPMEMMAGDGADVRRELSRLGLVIASSMSAKNKLLEYLTASEPKVRARCVQQTGWFDNVFVMPGKTIGHSKDLVMYQSESKTACQYAQAGTLDEWRDHVARLCIGNSRLMFAVSASFAGMILHHAKQESGGFHFVGESGTGKTTAQQIAASVYGSPSFKQSWKATGNALEGACALHNDAALILDELAEVDAKEVGSIVYMIGNGTGKGRAGRTGEARQRKTWRLMIISSGEIGLAQHMRDGGKTTRAGQEVRMIDIAVDGQHGMFDELHGFDGGAKLSDAIKEATQSYYGTPAIAFLNRITSDIQTFPKQLKQAMNVFVTDYLPANSGGQAARVCSKFALIAIAGEYATDAGITGWQQGDAVKAAATCFQSWLDSRGGGGNQERTTILSSVKAFFESHGESRFADIDDASNRATINRAGFRKTTPDGVEYFVLTEAYKRDVCGGYDMRAVTKVLTEAGWIELDSAGKASQSKTLPEMGKTRCYVLTPKMWEA